MENSYLSAIFMVVLVLTMPIATFPMAVADFFDPVDECDVLCWNDGSCIESECVLLGCEMCDNATCASDCDPKAEGESCTDDSQCQDGLHCSGGKRAVSYQRACCPEGKEWYYIQQQCLDEDVGEAYSGISAGIDSGIVAGDSGSYYLDTGFSGDYDGDGDLDDSDYYTMYTLVVPANCNMGQCINGDMNCDNIADSICYATEEICGDNIDNDADGIIDDGCCSEDACEECKKSGIWGKIFNPCDKSECESMGDCAYDHGWLVYFGNSCMPACTQEICIDETCNGIDDDCDGYIDDDCSTLVESTIIEQYVCYAWEIYADACVVECPECDLDEDDYKTKVELRYWSNPMNDDDTPWNRIWQRGCPDYFEPESYAAIDFSDVNLNPVSAMNALIMPSTIIPKTVGEIVGALHGFVEGIWGDIVGLAELAGMIANIDLEKIKEAYDNVDQIIENIDEIWDALISQTKNDWFDLRSSTAKKINTYQEECDNVILTKSYTRAYLVGFVGAQVALFYVSWLKIAKIAKLKIITKFKKLGELAGKGAEIFDVIDELKWLDGLAEEVATTVAEKTGRIAKNFDDEIAKSLAGTEFGKTALQSWDDTALSGIAKFLKEGATSGQLDDIFKGLSKAEIDEIGTKLSRVDQSFGEDMIPDILRRSDARKLLTENDGGQLLRRIVQDLATEEGWVFEEAGIVFRGVSVDSPDNIFKYGELPKDPSNVNLVKHVFEDVDSIFTGASSEASVGAWFARGRQGTGGYLFKIKNNGRIINVEKSLETKYFKGEILERDWEELVIKEFETPIVGKLEPGDIIGAWKVDADGVPNIEKFVPNPYYTGG